MFSSKVYHWKIEDFKNPEKLTESEVQDRLLILEEIFAASFPKPDDCPEEVCLKRSSVCERGLCHMALIMCGANVVHVTDMGATNDQE
jgi:hypothetical protein